MLHKTLPELPWQRRGRYVELGIKAEDADSFVRDPALGEFFEGVIQRFNGEKGKVVLASNYIANDLVNILKARRDTEKRDTEYQSEISISARNFNKIIDMVAAHKISSRAAKDILAESLKSARDPEEIAKSDNLYQVSAGGDFEAVVADVLAKNSSVVIDFKSGKGEALEYLVGQAMKALRGAGDPAALREQLKAKIGQS